MRDHIDDGSGSEGEFQSRGKNKTTGREVNNVNGKANKVMAEEEGPA